MSANPTIAALLSLLPTHTVATIPSVLLETATGLLAQSRSRAVVLKPEEEVARGWACAEIAVRRLQARLNLPAVFSNPPCPPRTYRKLYQFLDRVLVVSTSVQKVSSSSITVETSKSILPSGSGSVAYTTPSTTKSASKGNKPSKKSNTTVKKLKLGEIGGATDLAPSWLGPTVMHLCRKFSSAAAVPHVFVGVVSLLKSSLTSTCSEEGMNEIDLSAVAAAVFLLVTEKMHGVSIIDRSRNATNPSNPTSPRLICRELVALGRVSIMRAGGVLSSMERLLENKAETWRKMDWYKNVPDTEVESDNNVNVNDSDDKSQHESKQEYHGCDSGLSVRRKRSALMALSIEGVIEAQGLGGTDWLSAAHRRNYQTWKADVLERIENLEHPQT